MILCLKFRASGTGTSLIQILIRFDQNNVWTSFGSSRIYPKTGKSKKSRNFKFIIQSCVFDFNSSHKTHKSLDSHGRIVLGTAAYVRRLYTMSLVRDSLSLQSRFFFLLFFSLLSFFILFYQLYMKLQRVFFQYLI